MQSTLNKFFQTGKQQKDSQNQSMPRKRNPFSAKEDIQLIKLYKLYGKEKKYVWDLISLKMKGRTPRQCRERYELFLEDGIKRNVKWTKEEDEILLEKYELHGPHWKLMEKYFTGRTSYSIKNRYISLKRKESNENNLSKNEEINDSNILDLIDEDNYKYDDICIFETDNFFNNFQ